MTPDPKRMQDAIEKAYDAQVEKLFGVLNEGLMETAGKNPMPGAAPPSQVVFRFCAGMKIANDAYDKASAAVRNMGA